MIVGAALCPSPPLLARALTGQALVLPELRAACTAAVSHLLSCAPDLVIVVGPADVTAAYDAASRLDLSPYAPALSALSDSALSDSALSDSALSDPALSDPAVSDSAVSDPAVSDSAVSDPAVSDSAVSDPAVSDSAVSDPAMSDSAVSDSAVSDSAVSDPAVSDPDGRTSLPLAVGIGAMLLDQVGYAGPRLLQGVARSDPPDACLALGRELAAAAPRVALLAMGEGTARRSLSAPGYLDERAEPFDAAVERAVRDGDLAALAKIDPVLADDLMVTGRPAWQVLAGALSDGRAAVSSPASPRPETEIGYCAAPLGVAYLVATLV